MQVNRTEQKIYITIQEAMLLKRKLDAILPRDKNSQSEKGYEIRTLYFDTVDDRCCAEKEDGLRIHEKIRIRIYGINSDIIKLESKMKVGDAQIKKSMAIDKQTLDALIKGDYHVLLNIDNPMAQYFFTKLSDAMMPKCIIQYDRLSYCLPTNNIRITFDSNIRATESSFDLFAQPLLTHPIAPPDCVILEVKYNNFLFDYIKDALRGVRKSPSSFSKYFYGRTFHRYMI